MNPPPPIEVEKYFNSFVRSCGGELVTDVVGPSPAFPNADYFFKKQNVIAELKCLSKDVLADSAYQKKIEMLFDRWIASGLIANPGWGTFRIQSANLPTQCRHDLTNFLRQPLAGAVEKANRQIRSTKTNINLLPIDATFGVVIINFPPFLSTLKHFLSKASVSKICSTG